MIQPVNALTPKVLFRGDVSVSQKDAARKDMEKKIALINAGGVSVVLGAATTAIARSSTSSWKHAGYFGLSAMLISSMFLVPGFLYKSGIRTNPKPKEADVFTKTMEASKGVAVKSGKVISKV